MKTRRAGDSVVKRRSESGGRVDHEENIARASESSGKATLGFCHTEESKRPLHPELAGDRSENGVASDATKDGPCEVCGSIQSPLWRKVKELTTCNACGLRWRRHGSFGNRRPNMQRKPPGGPKVLTKTKLPVARKEAKAIKKIKKRKRSEAQAKSEVGRAGQPPRKQAKRKCTEVQPKERAKDAAPKAEVKKAAPKPKGRKKAPAKRNKKPTQPKQAIREDRAWVPEIPEPVAFAPHPFSLGAAAPLLPGLPDPFLLMDNRMMMTPTSVHFLDAAGGMLAEEACWQERLGVPCLEEAEEADYFPNTEILRVRRNVVVGAADKPFVPLIQELDGDAPDAQDDTESCDGETISAYASPEAVTHWGGNYPGGWAAIEPPNFKGFGGLSALPPLPTLPGQVPGLAQPLVGPWEALVRSLKCGEDGRELWGDRQDGDDDGDNGDDGDDDPCLPFLGGEGAEACQTIGARSPGLPQRYQTGSKTQARSRAESEVDAIERALCRIDSEIGIRGKSKRADSAAGEEEDALAIRDFESVPLQFPLQGGGGS